jgi:Lipocalin-like domain
MKNAFFFFLISLVLISCKSEIKESDISKINGYWEIEKVILASGEKKEYKISETIDYFQIKNKTGFRKKVTPQIDGKYLVNDVSETITISAEKSDYFINYKTQYLSWKEEIIELQDSVLVLKNKDDVVYHYKKSIPFSLK